MASEDANCALSDNMLRASNRSESSSSSDNWKFPLLELIEKNLFNCRYCQKFFTTGVFAVPGRGTVCKHCVVSMKWQGERVKFFDAFLQHMPVVPCTNAEAGCILQVLPEDLAIHVENCAHRPVQCIYPGCLYKRKQDDLFYHFRTSHAQHVIDEKQVFSLDIAEKTFVVAKLLVKQEFFDRYFVLIRRELNSDDILYNMFRLYKSNNNDGLVRHSCNDIQVYTKQIKTEPLDMIDKYNCLNRVSLAVLTEIFDGENQLSLTVDGTVSRIEKLLLCSGCGTKMRPPIYQCEKQHGICDSCSCKLLQCPICKNQLENKTRNVLLEALTSDVLYSCIYDQDGCTVKRSLNEQKQHEATCRYSTLVCPLPNCSYKKESYHARFEDHARDSHKDSIMSNSHEFKSSQINYGDASCVMCCHDRFFELKTRKTANIAEKQIQLSIEALDNRCKNMSTIYQFKCYLCLINDHINNRHKYVLITTRDTGASVVLTYKVNDDPLINLEIRQINEWISK